MRVRKSQAGDDTSDREIIISRLLDAPRELVWKAMTDPAHVIHWWGPEGFTTTIEEMDLRVGGTWRHVMHGPDGTDYPNRSTFKEIVAPERIVYAHGGGRRGGPGADFTATWTFESLGKQTRLTIHMLFDTPADRDRAVTEYGAVEGGKQTLERLAGYLPAMHTFVISRVMDAPRETLWQAWTDADRLQQWFGPKGVTTPACTLDLRPGGVFHYCMRRPDGGEMWGKWTFREIVAPQRLVFINAFSDARGGVTRHPFNADWPLELLSTVTLTALGDKTRVTVAWSPRRADSRETKAFDEAFDGMQQGWTGTYERLEAYLAGGR